jgi:hypothetical protein
MNPNEQQSPAMRFILMIGVVAAVVQGYARHRRGTPTKRSEFHTLSIGAVSDPYRARLSGKTEGLRLWSSSFSQGGVHVRFVMLLVSFPLLLRHASGRLSAPASADRMG